MAYYTIILYTIIVYYTTGDLVNNTHIYIVIIYIYIYIYIYQNIYASYRNKGQDNVYPLRPFIT